MRHPPPPGPESAQLRSGGRALATARWRSGNSVSLLRNSTSCLPAVRARVSLSCRSRVLPTRDPPVRTNLPSLLSARVSQTREQRRSSGDPPHCSCHLGWNRGLGLPCEHLQFLNEGSPLTQDEAAEMKTGNRTQLSRSLIP